MSTHSIILKRNGMNGFLSTQQSLGTVALNAMNAIPGVKNPKIVRESNEQVEITYSWVGDVYFNKINEHMADFGLVRVAVK